MKHAMKSVPLLADRQSGGSARWSMDRSGAVVRCDGDCRDRVLQRQPVCGHNSASRCASIRRTGQLDLDTTAVRSARICPLANPSGQSPSARLDARFESHGLPGTAVCDDGCQQGLRSGRLTRIRLRIRSAGIAASSGSRNYWPLPTGSTFTDLRIHAWRMRCDFRSAM
jgi:hypothetical protein